MRNWIVPLLSVAILLSCSGTNYPSSPAAPDPCVPQSIPARPGESLEITIPARDCVQLATNVHFPDGDGPYPVVLVRTPYGKGGAALDGINILFKPHGYAVVSQDARGRFDSEGEFFPFLNERADGADTMAWIEQQPWFDGNLGVWGASYLGITALLNTVERPDLVKAAFLAVVRSDVYAAAYEHGIIRADVGGTWALLMHDPDAMNFPTDEERDEALLKFPLAEGDKRTVGSTPLDDPFLENGEETRLFLDQLEPEEYWATDVPLMMFTGWFDFMARGQFNDWNQIYARRKGDNMHITVGPWPHLMGTISFDDYVFSDAGGLPFELDEMMAFFDHHLKGAADPGLPVARYYDGGTETWADASRLFPDDTKELVFYANGASDAVGCKPKGLLSQSQPAAESVGQYVYDPNQVIRINGGALLDLEIMGIREEINWCAGNDALVFETAPLTTDLTLAGPISASLRVASDVQDTVFVTRLYMVEPDGTAFNLREGAMLLSHRDGDRAKVDYTPGEQVTLDIPLTPLRWTLKAGQKLGLVVASTAYPFIVPHPNTAGNWQFADTPKLANQQVFTGTGSNGTRLQLTVAD